MEEVRIHKKYFTIRLLLVLSLLLLSACVQMRDYVGVRQGHLSAGVKQGFDFGADKKNYYVTDSGVAIVVNDTKDSITAKCGLPDTIEKGIDNYDCWTYKEKKLKLFFNGDYLKSWTEIEDSAVSYR